VTASRYHPPNSFAPCSGENIIGLCLCFWPIRRQPPGHLTVRILQSLGEFSSEEFVFRNKPNGTNRNDTRYCRLALGHDATGTAKSYRRGLYLISTFQALSRRGMQKRSRSVGDPSRRFQRFEQTSTPQKLGSSGNSVQLQAYSTNEGDTTIPPLWEGLESFDMDQIGPDHTSSLAW
jgi:hypothetical protein